MLEVHQVKSKFNENLEITKMYNSVLNLGYRSQLK